MAGLKICGIVDLAIADYCLSIGVDYIGFVFYQKSKRYIDFSSFKQIVSKLRRKKTKATQIVGLFVDSDLSEIKRYIDEDLLDIVQLHGLEDIEYITSLKSSTGVKIIKVVSLANYNLNYSSYQSCEAIDYLLFDSKTLDNGLQLAGSRTIDFIQLNESIIKTNLKKEWMLAGGLTAKNIVKAANQSCAKNFDISSGAEDAAGNKSKRKIFTLRQITNTLNFK